MDRLENLTKIYYADGRRKLVAMQVEIALKVLLDRLGQRTRGVDARRGDARRAGRGQRGRHVARERVEARYRRALATVLGEFGATLVLTRPEWATLSTGLYERLGRPGERNLGEACALASVAFDLHIGLPGWAGALGRVLGLLGLLGLLEREAVAVGGGRVFEQPGEEPEPGSTHAGTSSF